MNSPSTQILYWRGTYTSYTSFSTDLYSYPDMTINALTIAAQTKPSPVWQSGSAPAGCTAYWPLTEGSGTTYHDYEPTSAINGSAAGSGPTWATGSFGPETNTYTTSNYIAINPAAQQLATGTYPFWIAAMFKSSSTSDGLAIAQGSTTDNDPIVGLRINAVSVAKDTQYFLRDDAGGTPIGPTASNITTNDGVYHTFLGVSWAANNHRLYFDGVEVGTAGTVSLGTTTDNKLVIGCLLRAAASLNFPGTVVSCAIGSGAAPDPGDQSDDWLSGAFSAIRVPSSGHVFRVSSLEGLGGAGQQAFNPSLAGV